MSYIEGFLTPVPGHRRDDYVAHANAAFAILRDVGVTRLVEAWGEDVPRGTVNDLWGAVDAQAGETVVFSWFEYPDRATRDAASERMRTDPRMEALGAGMPFDMRRMIWGGFRVVSDAGVTTETAGFVDGVVLPLPRDADAAYRDHAAALAPVFLDHGARGRHRRRRRPGGRGHRFPPRGAGAGRGSARVRLDRMALARGARPGLGHGDGRRADDRRRAAAL
jgi:uncharacterized protein YbaA (DUF1428 family)